MEEMASYYLSKNGKLIRPTINLLLSQFLSEKYTH